jgi:CRP/FNR family cyclic AMP-dependent transcriptional regulator
MTEMLTAPYSDIEALGRADLYIDEIMEIVHQIDLFETLTAPEILAVCRHMDCYAAPRGYSLLQQGKSDGHMILLLSGTAIIKRSSQLDGEEIIAEVSAGTLLGEMSMTDSKPHLTSCVAITPMDFAVFSRETMNSILINTPRLGNKLLLTMLQLVSARLRDASYRFLPSLA